SVATRRDQIQRIWVITVRRDGAGFGNAGFGAQSLSKKIVLGAAPDVRQVESEQRRDARELVPLDFGDGTGKAEKTAFLPTIAFEMLPPASEMPLAARLGDVRIGRQRAVLVEVLRCRDRFERDRHWRRLTNRPSAAA